MSDMLQVQRTESRRRRLERLLVVVAAVLAALAVWAVAAYGVGVDVHAPQTADPAPQVGAANIVVVSAAASVAGWGLLAVLERLTERAAHVWAMIAAVVAVVSLIGPLTTPGFTGAGRVVLALLHLVVGAVVIPLLYRSSTSREVVSP